MQTDQISWLNSGSEVFYATGPIQPFFCLGDSSLVRLIQGICQTRPDQARKLLRNRIFTTATHLSEMDWGMLKVAAKRIELGAAPQDLEVYRDRAIAFQSRADHSAEVFLKPGLVFKSHEESITYALKLAREVKVASIRHQSSRRIAAVLVSPEGELLAQAVNTSATNRTHHAEVNLVQAFCQSTGKALPKGSRIYTTLKPCKMCAGMIWSSVEDPSDFTVYFFENDPGPHAQKTVFTRESFESRRALAYLQASFRDCEFQVLPEL